jgi:hypothetical protein
MVAPLAFFTPSLSAGSIAIGLVCKPLTTAMYGFLGALQGAVGVYVLTALGYATCSAVTAATIGFLAGAAIAAPFAVFMGLKAIFDLSMVRENQGLSTSMAFFALDIGITFLASLVMSTGLFLGATPAVAVVAGAAITNVAIEAVKDVTRCAMSWSL